MSRIGVVLICLSITPIATASDSAIDDLKRMFDYDSKQPLDVQEKLLYQRDQVKACSSP